MTKLINRIFMGTDGKQRKYYSSSFFYYQLYLQFTLQQTQRITGKLPIRYLLQVFGADMVTRIIKNEKQNRGSKRIQEGSNEIMNLNILRLETTKSHHS